MYVIYNKYSKYVFAVTTNVTILDEYNILDCDTGIGYSLSIVEYNQIDKSPDDMADYNYEYRDGTFIKLDHRESAFIIPENEYNSLKANIDYLMLLNDPDSASETVTE